VKVSTAGSKPKLHFDDPWNGVANSGWLDTFTGEDVRQGIYDAHLHKRAPVGRYNKKVCRGLDHLTEWRLTVLQPTQFNNTPYSNLHPDRSLRGKRRIAAKDYNAGASLEIPILKNRKACYNGKGAVGAGRVITWKGDAGRNEFVVVGHDESRGRKEEDKNEHYIATHRKAP